MLQAPPVTRAQIVAEARRWLKTRWLHQGRLLGVGVDCVGLAYEVGKAFRQFGEPPPPLPPYERVTADNLMLRLCEQFLLRRPGRLPAVGSVVAMRFDKVQRHMGIVGDYPGGGLSLIHAYAVNREVVEHRINEEWSDRIVVCWDFVGTISE